MNYSKIIKKYSPAHRSHFLVVSAAMMYAILLANPLFGQWIGCTGGSTTCTINSVGIGTNSPGGIIDIEGNGANVVGKLFSGDAGKFSYFSIGRTGTDLEIGTTAIAGQFFDDTTPGVGILKSYGPIMIGVNDTHPTITITNGGTNPGNVGIGTTNPQYALSVNGTIQAKEVIVNTGWADYVFAPNYRLQPLSNVATYIKEYHHLPGVPSTAEVKEHGVSLGEMQSTLLAKVEELTLQMIRLDEANHRLESENAELKTRVTDLRKRMPLQ